MFVSAQKSVLLACLTMAKLKMNQHVPNKNADMLKKSSLMGTELPSLPRSNHLVPFVTNFCPQLPRFNEIFSKFNCLLSDDIYMKELFPDKPVITYRRAPTQDRATSLAHTQFLALPFTHTTATPHTLF